MTHDTSSDGTGNPGTIAGYAGLLRELITGFDPDEKNYDDHRTATQFNVTGEEGNRVLHKQPAGEFQATIRFENCRNSRVMIGRNVRGNISVRIAGDNALVYIGNQCDLRDVHIRAFGRNALVAVGNGVTTTSTSRWISGKAKGNGNPALIIGDDCMFASDIVIRDTDAHPVLAIADGTQVNTPRGAVIIEPHVWIADRVAILKDVRIGACAIIGLGAVVTRNVDRFGVASGVPATVRVRPDNVWSRSNAEGHRKRALQYAERFRNP